VLNITEKISILIISNDYTHLEGIIKSLKTYFPKIYLSKKNEKTLSRVKKYTPKIIVYDNYSINDEADEIISIVGANIKTKKSQNILVLNGKEDVLKLNNAGNIFMLETPIDLKIFSDIFKGFVTSIKEELYAEDKINQYKQIFNNIDSIIFTTTDNEVLMANAKFFMFFGVKNISDFNEKHKTIGDMIVKKNGHYFPKNKDKWLEEIFELPRSRHVIALKNKNDEILSFAVYLELLDNIKPIFIVTLNDITAIKKINDFDKQIIHMDKTNEWRYIKNAVDKETHRYKRYQEPLSFVLLVVTDSKGNIDRLDRGDNKIYFLLDKIVTKEVRPTDYFGFLETNRYLIVMPHTKAGGAVNFLKRLDTVLRKNFYFKEYELKPKMCVMEHKSGLQFDQIVKKLYAMLPRALASNGHTVLHDESIDKQ